MYPPVQESHRRWKIDVRVTTGNNPTVEDAKKWFHHTGWFAPTKITMWDRGRVLLMENEWALSRAKDQKNEALAQECRDFYEHIVAHLQKLGVLVCPPNLVLN